MKLKTNYISLSVKRAIVDQVVNNSIEYDEDLLLVDFIQKEMALTLSLLQFYTDENIENIDLDEYYKNGKVDELKNLIPSSELSFLEKAIEYAIEEKKQTYNSLAGVLSRSIQKFIDKIPDEKSMSKLLKQVPKVMDNLSPENKEIFKGIMGGKIN